LPGASTTLTTTVSSPDAVSLFLRESVILALELAPR
jgi:hypothetical protein